MAVNPKVSYVMRGKEQKRVRDKSCGCMVTDFPLPKDADLLDILIIERNLDMEAKWAMTNHKHRDFEEYWYVVEGKGKFYIGDDVFDVEAGDLAIMPRDVPHKAAGTLKFICLTSLHNVYGQSIGRRMQFEATDKPYRDNPEDTPKVGLYFERDW